MDSSSPASTALSERLQALGLDPEILIPRYQALYELLLEANQRMNLTRITDWEGFCTKHVLDSLTVLPHLPAASIDGGEAPIKLLDLGSGGGMPGLPLWLARPEIALTMLDSVGKKLRAIDEMVNGLLERFPDLKEAPKPVTLHTRAEDAGQDKAHRQQYDVVVARAVAALPVLVELCLPLVKRTGLFFAMKGPSYESETEGLAQICGLLGARLDRVENIELGDEQRALLVFEKRSLTPKTLPRGAGQPQKKPLNEFI